uniref:CCHC-type domain-containing protein n=1 Tax=Callithrix jacchus TaxID=9483 RepID=A0A5F4VS73_CALJA
MNSPSSFPHQLTPVAPPTPSPHAPEPTPPTHTPQPPATEFPSSVTSPVAAHTRSHSPSVLAPLREVAGTKGLVRVHVPFSLQGLSQIEKCLGSFSADPSTYIKEFQYLTQAYSLTWHDIRVICTSTLTTEEHERILAAARQQADRDHLVDDQVPLGTQVLPNEDPLWNYQAGQGSDIPHRDHMIRYLLRGMDIVSNKVVNYDKLREITQLPDENPALFLTRLQDALTRFTRLDPASQNGATVLASHFISQSAPDIRKKLKKVEDGPETPIQDLVKMAFKVCNAREDAAEAARQTRMKQKVTLQTQALVAALRPAGSQRTRIDTCTPPGACFKCGKEGHWSKACPQPHPPTKPCPICQLMGHWKSDCPSSPRASVPSNRCTGEQQGHVSENQAPAHASQESGTRENLYPELLGFMDDWRCPGFPTPVTLAEPRVKLQVAGKSVSFLLDTEATYSVLPSYSGKTTSSQVSVIGIDGSPSTPHQTPPLTCLFGPSIFTHSFLVIPSCPVPLLGRDILVKLQATITFPHTETFLLPLITNSPSPLLWPNSSPM